ncbi:MAG TPA: cobalamin-dependent protein [Allosphingosinicella sp.]
MKVLFVKPPFPKTSFISRFAVCEPLEFAVLAANAEDIADFRLLDMRVDNAPLESTINEYLPDVVCFTALTMDVPKVRALCRTTKESESSPIVCVGGEHATFLPQSFADVADYVFQGRAIEAFRSFLVDVRSSAKMPRLIPGDTSHKFLIPRRTLHDAYQKEYVYGAMFDISLATLSVGCPFRCTYCSVPGTEPRHVVDTVDHAMAVVESAPTNNILYTDSNFLANRRVAAALLRELGDHPRKFKIMVSFRSDTIARHPELTRLLADAGVKVGAMGLESTDGGQLLEWDKQSTVSDNDTAIDMLHDAGIMVRGNFVITQDFDSVRFASLEQYIDQRNIEFPTFQILTPLPGSLDYPKIISRCVVKDFKYFDLSHSVLPLAQLPARRFHEHFKGLFEHSYSARKLLRLAPRLPAWTAVRGAFTALTSRLAMSYDKQDEFFLYHC